MKSIVLGIGLMIAASIIAWAVLGTQQQDTGQALVSDNNSVRLDD